MRTHLSFIGCILSFVGLSAGLDGGPSIVSSMRKVNMEYEKGLVILPGIKTGHVQYINVGGENEVKVITRAMKPSVFEIPDFLTEKEIANIIKRAKDPKDGGMFESVAKGGLTKFENFTFTGESGQAKTIYGKFKKWDWDEDKKISLQEILAFLHVHRLIYMKEVDVKKMFEKLNIKEFDDDVITEEEFATLNTIGIEEYVTHLYNEVPRFKERHSKQAWLFMDAWTDPMMNQIREKVLRITGLPREIVYGGEMLQVLNYGRDGHYNAHYDSETHLKEHIPCCHQVVAEDDSLPVNEFEKCKLCRFATFLLYLNDVEGGGETAFPVADNATYSIDNMRSMGDASTDKFNLAMNCQKANLVVPPKKGTAVLFYNHLLNDENPWMGEQDMHSLHGGCVVTKGEKWLANMWFPAPYGRSKDLGSIYLNKIDFHEAEKKFANSDLEYLKKHVHTSSTPRTKEEL